MSKLIVIFLLARLGRKGKCSTGGGGGVRILNATAHFCSTLQSYAILDLFNQAHDVFFCVYDVLYREEESFSSSVKNTDVNLYHHYSTLEV